MTGSAPGQPAPVRGEGSRSNPASDWSESIRHRTKAPAGGHLSRVGVIGDVHAAAALLASALELLATHAVDAVVCAGDVVDGPGDADLAVALLRDSGVITVRGNHDRWLLNGELRDLPDAHRLEHLAPDTREWLNRLPPQVRLATPHGELLVCHGLGADDMNRLAPDQFGYSLEVNAALHDLIRQGAPRLVIKGHTHRRAVYTCGPLVVLDAGTLAGHGPPSTSILDLPLQQVISYVWADEWQEAEKLPLPPYAAERVLPRSHADLNP